MNTVHLFEEGYYLIGNKAVAKSFMFGDENDCKLFQSKIDKYLSPLCDILAYGFLKDEFQLVVRLKSRSVFEDYFLSKFEIDVSSGDIIPESTYIFAQAMANLQSGYAKYFNYKNKRDGGLMKGRYFRELIESEAELGSKIEEVNSLEVQRDRNSIWTFRRKEAGYCLDKVVGSLVRSSRRCYEVYGAKPMMQCFVHLGNINLRGQFDTVPPKRIDFKNKHESLRNLVQFMLLKSK